MKSYLEIRVPLRYDASWFEELRAVCHDLSVKWQTDYYHITMAFIDDTPENVDLQPILDRHLAKLSVPYLSFDKLDVFTANSGMHIINLTTKLIPKEFSLAIENIRSELKSVGCRIDSSFRLHVTLGRVIDSTLDAATIQGIVSKIQVPVLSFFLTDVDYREFRGRILYKTELTNRRS